MLNMQSSLMTLQELRANDAFGGAQLVPGPYYLTLTQGQARMYEWTGGDPDSLVETDDNGNHHVLRELVGAGDCRFVPVEPRSDKPDLRVHDIVTPNERVIGTLVTRLVSPDRPPRNIMDRVLRVADRIAGFGPWLFTGRWGKPEPELRIRVRASQIWNEA